jgi:hypothetical protein
MVRPRGRTPIALAIGVAVAVIGTAGCQNHTARRPSSVPTSTNSLVASTTTQAPGPTPSTSSTTLAPATSAVPVLGKPWAPYQRGYGTIRPIVIDNGGDPTGIVSNVTWKSWGGAQAVGFGTGNFDPPDQPVAASRPEPATVVAFDPGTCLHTFMYRQVEWYFPGEGQSLNTANAMNICASDTQATSGVAVSQAAAGVPSGVVSTFSAYFAAIDSGDYQAAYSRLSPKEQATTDETQFAANLSTTTDENVAVTGFQATGPNTEQVTLVFTSQQSANEGPGGATCDTWNLTYTLVLTNGSWLIDSTKPSAGSGYTSC